MKIEDIKKYLVNKAISNYEDVATQYSLMNVKISSARVLGTAASG